MTRVIMEEARNGLEAHRREPGTDSGREGCKEGHPEKVEMSVRN